MASELVLKGSEKAQPALFKQYLESKKAELSAYATAEISTDRFIKLAVNCIAQDPKLQNCTIASVYKAAAEVFDLGLEVSNTSGHAYLIPYGDNCTFQLGYKGQIALLRRNGYIDDLWAQPVFKGEVFELEMGTSPFIKHLPHLDGGTDEKNFRGAYCVIKLKGVSMPHIEYMNREQIEFIKRTRRGARQGDTWDTQFVRMAVKTVIRRAITQMDIRGKVGDAIGRDAEEEGFVYEDRSAPIERPTDTSRGVSGLKEKLGIEAAAVELTEEEKALQEANALWSDALAVSFPETAKRLGKDAAELLKATLGRTSEFTRKYWSSEDLAKLQAFVTANEAPAATHPDDDIVEAELKPEAPVAAPAPIAVEQTELMREFLSVGGNAAVFNTVCPTAKATEETLAAAFQKIDGKVSIEAKIKAKIAEIVAIQKAAE